MKLNFAQWAAFAGSLVLGQIGTSSAARADPIYLECTTADAKGKKVKALTFSLDEAAQTASGALGVMDGSFAGSSPESDKNMSALSAVLGGEAPKPGGVNLRTTQTRKAVFTADHVEFSLLQPTGGDSMSVSIAINRVDLTIVEKYPLMKARNGTCRVAEPVKRAF